MYAVISLPSQFCTYATRQQLLSNHAAHPSSGLLLCGQNKYVRHWLDVFLRDKLPPRVVVNLTHDQEFLLHMHVSQWNRSFTVKQNQFEWVEPPPTKPQVDSPLECRGRDTAIIIEQDACYGRGASF